MEGFERKMEVKSAGPSRDVVEHPQRRDSEAAAERRLSPQSEVTTPEVRETNAPFQPRRSFEEAAKFRLQKDPLEDRRFSPEANLEQGLESEGERLPQEPKQPSPHEQLVDVDTQIEKTTASIGSTQKRIDTLQGELGKENFKNAEVPPSIQTGVGRLEQLRKTKEGLEGQIAGTSTKEQTPSVEEGSLNPEGLESKGNIEETMELFKGNKLLARAMEPARLGADGDFHFEPWDEELKSLGKEGLQYVSTTLLVAGEEVPTYKSYGMLVDSDKAEIAHIAKDDSNSRGSTPEDFSAAETDVKSLEGLADIIKNQTEGRINEVNAHFRQEAVRGLFVTKESSVGKVEAYMTQLYLMTQGEDLPLFVYSQKMGELEPADFTSENVEQLLAGVKTEKLRVKYKESIEKYQKSIESQKKEKLLKTQEHEKIRHDVEQITDAMGKPIEAGIMETIVALNALGINTSQSCEGHEDIEGGSRLWPWVEISAPDEPEERFVGENALFEQTAQEHGVKVEDLKRGHPEELFWEVKKKASANEETSEYKKWEQHNSQLYKLILELLNKFYEDREVQDDIKLKLDENNSGSFEISSEKQALFKMISGELTGQEKQDLVKKLPKRREEMKAFTEFLKESFFKE